MQGIVAPLLQINFAHGTIEAVIGALRTNTVTERSNTFFSKYVYITVRGMRYTYRF